MENNPENQKERLDQHVFELAEKIEMSEDPEFIREHVEEFFENLKEKFDIELESDISSLYEGMRNENCLARIDALSRIVKVLETNEPASMGNEEIETHYANAVIPESEGIKLAFAEGQAPGPVRMLIGFGKTLVGFKTDHLEVSEIDFSETDPRNTAERKYLCRHVSGELTKDDIRYVVMRMPRNVVPEAVLSDEEKTDGSMFVFRGFKI